MLYPFVDIREETSILEHFYKETVLYPFVDIREETSILEHFIRRLCYTPLLTSGKRQVYWNIL